MNKNLLNILSVFLFFIGLHLNSALAADKIIITLHQPPPNQLSIGDVWKMTLDNTTSAPINIYLIGYVEKDNDRIVDGRSANILLPPGRSNYNYRSFETGTVNWTDNTLKEFILRTNSVPAGNYKTCITAYSSDSENVVGKETCIFPVIIRQPEGEISLISPSDGETIDDSPGINFIWQSTFTGGQSSYKIRIVEIKGSQSQEAAMKNNLAFYEKDRIVTTSFSYPQSAPKFVKEKKYAWGILKENTLSEIWTFIIKSKDKVKSDTTKIFPNIKIPTPHTVTPLSTYNTVATLTSVCIGTSSVISLDQVFTPVTDYDFQWLISEQPCATTPSGDPASYTPITIDPSSGNFTPALSGWMSLTGFTGTTYTTPTSLHAGQYCFSCAISIHASGVWIYSTPLQFLVAPPVVAGTLTFDNTVLCNNGAQVTITVDNYTATSWIWEYNLIPGSVWTPLNPQPVFTPTGPFSFTTSVSGSAYYKVTFQNGVCPDVAVAGLITLTDPPPDGSICVQPDIQTVPAPGLGPCINPPQVCPTTWLTICPGCDAILTLTDAAGNPYPWTNTLQWDYLEEPYDYTTGTPPQYSVNPLVTPPTNIINGVWTPTGFTGNTSVNTNRLYTTTWYRAVAHDPTGLCPDKIFYCVVLVIQAPPPPVIGPPGPITTCVVPVSETLSLQLPYAPDGFNLEYMWTSNTNPTGTWLPFPVQPYEALDYGSYTLRIKNECGESVSDTFKIKPEDIPVELTPFPCCVCEGECVTITATYLPLVTYSWACTDPTVILDPSATNVITLCTGGNYSLTVTIPSGGCSKVINFSFKVCQKY